jgi:hypothetical protein
LGSHLFSQLGPGSAGVPLTRIPQVNPVLGDAQWVIRQPLYADHVRLTDAPLEEALMRGSFELPNWELFIPSSLRPERAFGLILTGNAINAAYTDHQTGKKFTRGSLVGSEAMWDALFQSVQKERVHLDGPGLAQLTMRDMKSIFGGDYRLPDLPGRLAHLRNLGEVLIEKYKGKFANLMEASRQCLFGLDGLVTRLTTQFEAYSDYYAVTLQSEHRIVEFNKRAQLAAGALVGWTRNKPVPDALKIPRSEVAKLTVYADYVLPMIQLHRGRLRFSSSLVQAITDGAVLREDDPRVIAFRAATIVSCEEDVTVINHFRSQLGADPIMAVEYDAQLWLSLHRKVKPHPIVDTLRF